jgi:hypothetical protein
MLSRDVAEILGCQPGTVDEYARSRKLPAVKLAGGWVFTPETLIPAINRMIEEHMNDRQKPAGILIREKNKRPDLSRLVE